MIFQNLPYYMAGGEFSISKVNKEKEGGFQRKPILFGELTNFIYFEGDLLHHRKRKHKEHVQPCNNIRNGKCTFGKEKCWFNHEGHKPTKENENENNSVVQRILIMMEKMTERIVKMEMNNEKEKEKDDIQT